MVEEKNLENSKKSSKMATKKIGNYYIGLDIGTTSVGWAVMDARGTLLKAKGKEMWGARLFDEAQTAEKRRVFRGARRRYFRRRQRIELLQELMLADVAAVDPSFFMRMNQSFLQADDAHRTLAERFDVVFNDLKRQEMLGIKTIYHLRQHLMATTEKADIRLIYLALHHIIKYRGNFLYEGKTFDSNENNVAAALCELYDAIGQIYEDTVFGGSAEQVATILLDNKIKNSDKSKNIDKLWDVGGKMTSQIAKLITGQMADISVMTGDENLVGEDDKNLKVSFSKSSIDEDLPNILEAAQDYEQVIVAAKKVYDSVILMQILGDENDISAAMVHKYNEHKKQLAALKEIFKKYDNKSRHSFFSADSVDKKVASYAAYLKGEETCNKQKIKAAVEKVLLKADSQDEDVKLIKAAIEAEELLPKLNEKSNSVIPYQLNLNELEKIIDRQAKFYPLLAASREKIISLLTFRIPYYVGPLNRFSDKSWVVKKEECELEKIYPWNFNEVVDDVSSAKGFINKMLSTCTYIQGEKVMPKKSLTCSKYEVVAELANISLDGKALPTEIYDKALSELFMSKRSVTIKDFVSFLAANNVTYTQIDGFADSKRFMSSLAPHIDFTDIFGEINQSNCEKIEDIIECLATLDGKIIKKYLKSTYSDLSDEQLNKIVKIAGRYKGWSSLSRKFVDGIKAEYNGRRYTILEFMTEYRLNLQATLSGKYPFKRKLEELGGVESCDINIEKVQALATSPANKRAIWQAIRIVKEIVQIMGTRPCQIAIEFAKGGGKKGKRTSSRYDTLEKLYKKIKEDAKFYDKEVGDELKSFGKDNKKLDIEKYFLYFLQNGKCLYTGEKLCLDRLEQYEVDHILPRSLIKDDSIDNKALVKKLENQMKADDFTLSWEVRDRMKKHGLWYNLKKSGLMSGKKYKNLTRDRFSPDDVAGFINRQLVETRQITKHVANLLAMQYANSDGTQGTRIMSIRANLVYDCKSKYNVIKLRDINDFHHAVDAYVCSYIAAFTHRVLPNMQDVLDNNKYYYKMPKLDDATKNGYILDAMDKCHISVHSGEVLYMENEAAQLIKKVASLNSPIITKQSTSERGALFKATLLPAGEGKVAAKGYLDVEKYGGYTNVYKSYLAMVEYADNKKTKKEIIGVPIMLIKQLKKGESLDDKFIDYIITSKKVKCKKQDIKILKYFNNNQKAVFTAGKKYIEVYIASEQYLHNAMQLHLPRQQQEQLAEILSFDRVARERLISKNKQAELKSEETLSAQADEFYIFYLNKIKQTYPRIWNTAQHFEKVNFFEEFKVFPLEKKAKFLSNILRLTACKSCQLTFKPESKEGDSDVDDETASEKEKEKGLRYGTLNKPAVGMVRIVVSDAENMRLINESITGLYRSVEK